MLSKNQLREVRALHLKKNREHSQRFIAEGIKMVTEIVRQHPSMVETIFGEPQALRNISGEVRQHGLKVVEVTEEELRAISLQSNPNAILAVCRHFDDKAPQSEKEDPFCFYLDEIRDPGNLGTIIRLCDWFGVSNLYCSHGCCELYNPKVIQASMGAFLRVNVVYLPLRELKERKPKMTVYGAVLRGRDMYGASLRRGIIVIGNEANGISPANMNEIQEPVTIPASGGNGSESLNAAMATAIIASEFYRQIVRV